MCWWWSVCVAALLGFPVGCTEGPKPSSLDYHSRHMSQDPGNYDGGDAWLGGAGRELTQHIRRILISSSTARKATLNANCGSEYTIKRKTAGYRFTLSQNKTCNIIFRAGPGSSVKVVCLPRLKEGPCSTSSTLTLHSHTTSITLCSEVGSKKAKLKGLPEVLVSYQVTNLPTRASPITCTVTAKRGNGYKASGKQICPLTCGATTPNADATMFVRSQSAAAQGKVDKTPGRESQVNEGDVNDGNTLFPTTTDDDIFGQARLTPKTVQIDRSLEGKRIYDKAIVEPRVPRKKYNILVNTDSVATLMTPDRSLSTVKAVSRAQEYGEVDMLEPVPAIWDNIRKVYPSDRTPNDDFTRVQGGQMADVGEWPWMIRLVLRLGGATLFCGGTLLSPSFILTAAHCVYDVDLAGGNRIKVIANEYDTSRKDETRTQVVETRKIFLHPDYNKKTEENDLAVLEVTKALVLGPGVTPVCLAPPGEIYQGQEAVVLGWGSLSFYGDDATILREGPQTVMDVRQCARNYSTLNTNNVINQNHLCTAKPGVDSCVGDSGGPVLVRRGATWYQLGVISWGKKCAEPGYPGVNALVPAYITWITNTIKQAQRKNKKRKGTVGLCT